jgi:hypothetical protein
MTGAQSRLLATGNRVGWDNSLTDRGTIADTNWSGVEIVWDVGRTEFYLHNDMARVTLVGIKK